jgi:hypothetical protein
MEGLGLHARALSVEEKRIAVQVFGDTLPLFRVLVSDGMDVDRPAGLLVGASYTMEMGPDVFVNGANRPGKSGLLVHHLTHVWQAIHGRGRWVASLRHDGTVNDPHPGAPWESCDAEQQARIVERWYAAGASDREDDELFPYIRDVIRNPVGRRRELGPFTAYHDGSQRVPEARLDVVGRGVMVPFAPRVSGSGMPTGKGAEAAARPSIVEKLFELAFVVTCQVTGKPLPNAPFEVYDADRNLLTRGQTDRKGEARWDAGIPGQYKVVAFPNDHTKLEIELVDDNGELIVDTDVLLTDSEGKTIELRTDARGIVACENLQCGRVTFQVGDKRVRAYVDSQHPDVRRLRVRDYFVPPPAWMEIADRDEPSDEREA